MKNFIRKCLSRLLKFYFARKVTYNGFGHRFSRFSSISLGYGATKKQIILDDGVKMYGKIRVQGPGVVHFKSFSQIGNGSTIQCVNKVYIGECSAIGENTVVSDNNTHPTDPAYRREMQMTPSGSCMRAMIHSENRPIIIGENVWIGSNARICKGVTIGDNSIVAANSVVTKDVPKDSIVAGNPARVVKTFYCK